MDYKYSSLVYDSCIVNVISDKVKGLHHANEIILLPCQRISIVNGIVFFCNGGSPSMLVK